VEGEYLLTTGVEVLHKEALAGNRTIWDGYLFFRVIHFLDLKFLFHYFLVKIEE
jgi:hypothetical protein